MGVYRTALVLGALTLSIPAFGQDSRYGVDRSRAERGRQDGRSDSRAESKNNDKNSGRNNGKSSAGKNGQEANRSYTPNGNRSYTPGENRSYTPGDNRTNRAGRRDETRADPRVRVDDRSNRVEVRTGRRDDQYDRRDTRYDRRDTRYDGRANYRYDAGDFRRRDVPMITIWFRNRGLMHAPAYGLRDRYDFRPGIYLSTMILARLDVLPFDLELELGALPWYLERRIYGRTVLVIDTRTRLVVDMYDFDW
jgi:hypothetical protein